MLGSASRGTSKAGPEKQQRTARGAGMESHFAKIRVLLIDRTPQGKNALRGIVTSLGIRKLEMRHDAVMALQLLRKEAFDVVFCDEWLEPMSAESFVKVLRHDVRSCDMSVPVLLVTTGANHKHVERVREAGVSDILVKPVSAEIVRRKLEAHLCRGAGFAGIGQYLTAERRKIA